TPAAAATCTVVRFQSVTTSACAGTGRVDRASTATAAAPRFRIVIFRLLLSSEPAAPMAERSDARARRSMHGRATGDQRCITWETQGSTRLAPRPEPGRFGLRCYTRAGSSRVMAQSGPPRRILGFG